MTAKAIGTGSLFGPIGGAVVGARAASVGKDLMAKHKVVDDRLLYRGRARLIDTEQGRVAWQGACDHREPERARFRASRDCARVCRAGR